MQLRGCLLCNFAEVRDGMLYVVGGCITRLWRDELPAEMGASLALVFELHQQELERPHELNVQVMGPDGEQVGTAVGAFNAGGVALEPGEGVLVPVALDMRSGGITVYGGYVVNVAVDGTHLGESRFWVQPRPPIEVPDTPEGI
jgi:hypothetical protein